MTKTEVMDKLQKLMNLAKDGSNENESMAALVKAQKLMAEHSISEKELVDKPMKELGSSAPLATHSYSVRHRMRLSTLIADNFRCVVTTYKKKLYLFGIKEDVDIATDVFNMACYVMHRRADNFARRTKCHSDYGSYMDGFLTGLQVKFTEQKAAHQEWGLVLVKDALVTEAVAKMGRTQRASKMEYVTKKESFEVGYTDGHSFSDKKRIGEEE